MNSVRKDRVKNKELDRIAVIGAGASGIICARELIKRGWKNVVLFEAQNQAGGKTRSISLAHSSATAARNPNIVELGTQILFDGPVLKELLQDTGLDKDLFSQPYGRIRNLSESKSYHPLFVPLPQLMSFRQKMMESIKFLKETEGVTILNKPGFRGLPGQGLSMSIEQWFDRNNFPFSKFMSLPFVSTGLCGAEYDRVPVAYMMKLQQFSMRFSLFEKIFFVNKRVALGNAEIWRRAAVKLDVRYNQSVQAIQIDSGFIHIGTSSKESFSFEHMIWTGRLPSLGKLIGEQSSSAQGPASSRGFYPKVQYMRRAVFVYRVEGLPGNIVWLHSDEILKKNHGSPFITINLKGGDWYSFYPWLAEGQSIDDVDRKIRDYVAKLGGRVLSMVTDPVLWDYNPFFSGDLLEQGVFDLIENDQGKDGIYVCGETLSGVTLPAVTEYAKDLVERYF